MVTATHELTDRQGEIYEFIRCSDRNVTLREIGRAMGIRSPNGVMSHLKALEKKCLITRDERTARGIRLTSGPNISDLHRLLSGEKIDGMEITVGGGRFRLQYLRPATTEEMQ